MAAPHPVLLRLVDHARRAAAGILAPSPASTSTQSDLTLTHQPGDHVIDLVTGQEGTVYAGQRHADLVRAPNPKVD